MNFTAAEARKLADQRTRTSVPDEYCEVLIKLMHAANGGARYLHVCCGDLTAARLRSAKFGVRRGSANGWFRVDW